MQTQRRKSKELPRFKVVLVGDGAVGKTCLLAAYTTRTFPGDYVPTVFDNYDVTLQVDGRKVLLSLWDSAGQEDFDRLRPLAYPDTSCFIVCASAEHTESLNNAANKWLPEIRHHCGQSVPALLAITKWDRRPDSASETSECASDFVTNEALDDTARHFFNKKYLPNSALSMDGVDELFMEAAVAAAMASGSLHKRRLCAII
ncbi:MAG: hypothetical protein MHM6MM_005209 [Cercozoa sp. M6MM]